MSRLELWAGFECTVNRVGDLYFDQFVRSGHEIRADDLNLLSDIGATAVRYPVLWEKVSPADPETRDFSSADERLARLSKLGVRPILGLCHHGSGPRYTSLLDPGFAQGLAKHARATARRYPWIVDWTPVNEPLTTARFSALYGLWYPHLRDEKASVEALLNQVDAIRLSMTEIRRINPGARLIQTEDLGFTHAPQSLAAQAEYENERRWLTWDLLCGTVTREHALWDRLVRLGFEDRLLAAADNPCPPDVIGVNHYLTSERFLDPRLDLYPERLHGGNGLSSYVDVEAVRVAREGALGWKDLLRQTWERYGRTLAVTEAHNGCTRDEQMRWLLECWRACEELRADGVSIEAVTAWALLGSCGWSNLLTSQDAPYECGVYDLRSGQPRATALVPMLKALAGGREPDAARLALASPGWWRRPDVRYEYPPSRSTAVTRYGAPGGCVATSGPILITGATGTLGQAFGRACRHRGLPFVATGRGVMAIDDPRSISDYLDSVAPLAVINTAGFVRVDDAESERDACFRDNAEGAGLLAQACAARNIALVSFSSDLVFDGRKGSPYVESDAVAPLNVYGRSKAEAERAILSAECNALVVRTAAFFSQRDPWNFAVQALSALSRGDTFEAASDLVVSPTYVPDLVEACLDLLIDAETGIWHLANQGRVSWAEFARRLAEGAGLDPRLVCGRPAEHLGLTAQRPLDVALDSERGRVMPTLDSAIERFMSGWSAAPLSRSLCPPEEGSLAEAAE